MANYLTTDTDLEAVADAIRAKSNGSGSLAFPSGFVSAIENIETGGGGEDMLGYYLTNNALLQSYENEDVKTMTDYLFYGRTSVKHLSFPNVGSLSEQCFRGCTGLISINLPKANGNWYSSQQFYGCSNLAIVVLPKWTSGITKEMFRSCTALTAVDIGGIITSSAGGFAEKVSANAFNGASAFKTLIMRANTIGKLDNVNAFTGTPFASGGSGGTLYVPASRVESYKTATNWATIFGYGDGEQNNVLPIEGSIYETQYADGTPIS